MRWQDFTGEDARLEDGRSFDEVKSERLVKAGEASEVREEVAQEEGHA